MPDDIQDVLEKVKEAQVVEIKPGDLVFLKIKERIPATERELIMAWWQRFFGVVPFVGHDDMELYVLRKVSNV